MNCPDCGELQKQNITEHPYPYYNFNDKGDIRGSKLVQVIFKFICWKCGQTYFSEKLYPDKGNSIEQVYKGGQYRYDPQKSIILK